MTESTHNLLKWAFEGVGGALLAGCGTWSQETPNPHPDSPLSMQTAKAVGGDANVSTSHKVGVEARSVQKFPGHCGILQHHPLPS